MKFYTRYNPPPHKGTEVDPVGMTEQQYKAECDINTILQNYKAVGVPVPNKIANFGDVSMAGDFARNLQLVTEATQAFEQQPSAIRARFGHDPAAFYQFVSDPQNRDELLRLGLIEAPDTTPTTTQLLQKIVDGVTAKPAEPATSGEGNA